MILHLDTLTKTPIFAEKASNFSQVNEEFETSSYQLPSCTELRENFRIVDAAWFAWLPVTCGYQFRIKSLMDFCRKSVQSG